MPRFATISQARQRLASLPKELAGSPEPLAVTRKGKPVLAVMPWDDYLGLLETVEVLSDSEQMAAVRQGLAELDQGRGVPLDEALGLARPKP